MNTFDFGIIGLGVMGRNLLLNMADQKYAVAGLDLDVDKVLSLTEEANPQHRIKATIDVKVCRTDKAATGNYVACPSRKACRQSY
jgi:6-phosphogluconate dehydrogenase